MPLSIPPDPLNIRPQEPVNLWSVTTLISNGTAKPALVGWAAKVVAEYAVDHRAGWGQMADSDRDAVVKMLAGSRFKTNERASTRGNDVHAALEQIDLGVEPLVQGEAAPYVEQYRKFLAEHRPTPLLAEATVYNPELGYAGTLDKIMQFARWGTDAFIVDVKTTDKAKAKRRSGPPYPEVALQLVAYRRAPLVGIEPPVKVEKRSDRHYVFDPVKTILKPMPETRGAFVLVVSPYDYELVPVVTDEDVWESFLHVKGVAEWALEKSKGVLAKPVPPLPVAEAA